MTKEISFGVSAYDGITGSKSVSGQHVNLNHACNVDVCVTDQKGTLSIITITKRMHM